MIPSNKRMIKALIKLGSCAGWSAPLLFANSSQGFSNRGLLDVLKGSCFCLATRMRMEFHTRQLDESISKLRDIAK